MIDKKYIGTSFDSFLEEEDILQESEAVALKRVIAYALEEKMKADNISVNRLAKELETSRTAICRILDPENTSITLNTIEKVAKYLGKKIVLSFA
ncbi:MAG: helix-turn-helix domain-containing protein [bacterium]|nr:helix-turn-helix domain-containing protein [bacterium]